MLSVMPKNRPGDTDLAYAFIDHSLDPLVQGKMAEDIYNGPVNAKAIISAEARKSPYILTPEQIADKAIMHDNAFLATVHDQWIRRIHGDFLVLTSSSQTPQNPCGSGLARECNLSVDTRLTDPALSRASPLPHKNVVIASSAFH
jgi:hypothetical protein